MRSWSYEEITQTTEAELRTLNNRASELEADIPLVKRLVENARGVYYLWNSLTDGVAPESDQKRLLTLAAAVGTTIKL